MTTNDKLLALLDQLDDFTLSLEFHCSSLPGISESANSMREAIHELTQAIREQGAKK